MSSTENSKFVSSAIRFSPLIWLVGASSLAYQAIGLWPILSGRKRISKLSILQLFVIAYSLIYITSIMLAAIEGAELMRLLAASYNLSVWIVGAIVLNTIRNQDEDSIRKSARLVLACLTFACIAAYFTFSGMGSVRFNSLIGYLIGAERLPENLAANTNLYITSADWSTLGLGSRLSIMAPYPTALGMLALVLIGLAAPSRWDSRSFVRFAPYVAAALLLSFLCASRATMGSMLLFVVAVIAFYVARTTRSLNFKVFLVTAFIAIGIIATLIFSERLTSAWSSVNATRAESSSLRFELYTLSVQSALEEHPLLGFGVKERISTYAIPLGSHSTIFGSMYKTGIIGFSVMAMFFSYVAFLCVRTGFSVRSCYRAGLAAACVSMLPLLIFEDIDAIPLVAYLFFVSLALMERASSVEARELGNCDTVDPRLAGQGER